MKKINLFAIASASLMMLACTDYEGQLTDAYEKDVESDLDDMAATSSQLLNGVNGDDVCADDPSACDPCLINPDACPMWPGVNDGNVEPSGCGDLWCGATYTEDRIDASMLPFMEETGGYWYDYNDEFDGGNSKFVWPSDVHENVYGNFFGPMIEKYGALKGTAILGTGAEYPSLGLGFNLVNESQDPADITDFGGFCLQYTSDQPFYVALRPYDEAGYTEYNNYTAMVKSSGTKAAIDIPWGKFKQERGWGNQVALADFLTRVVAVQLKFTTTGDFEIYSIGRLGTCN